MRGDQTYESYAVRIGDTRDGSVWAVRERKAPAVKSVHTRPGPNKEKPWGWRPVKTSGPWPELLTAGHGSDDTGLFPTRRPHGVISRRLPSCGRQAAEHWVSACRVSRFSQSLMVSAYLSLM